MCTKFQVDIFKTAEFCYFERRTALVGVLTHSMLVNTTQIIKGKSRNGSPQVTLESREVAKCSRHYLEKRYQDTQISLQELDRHIPLTSW